MHGTELIQYVRVKYAQYRIDTARTCKVCTVQNWYSSVCLIIATYLLIITAYLLIGWACFVKQMDFFFKSRYSVSEQIHCALVAGDAEWMM